MYYSMDTDFFASCLYFLVAVIVLNFWLINLLTAVVVNTFKDIRTETAHSAFGADEWVPRRDAAKCSAIAGVEPQWSTEKSKKAQGKFLKVYEKTEWFWTLLVLTDLIAQAVKTARSSQSTLDLLSAWCCGRSLQTHSRQSRARLHPRVRSRDDHPRGRTLSRLPHVLRAFPKRL